jgi:hypothetical protein
VSQPKEGSPLIQAVRAFDAELERFAAAASSACRRPLDSKRELEKAAEWVREAAQAEEAMQLRAKELLLALKASEADQQARAQALQVRTQEIQGRFDAYAKLAERYRALGAEGATLVESAQQLRSDRKDQPAPLKAELVSGLSDLEQRVAVLRDTARVLAADARTELFDDIANEAHAVEQTLSSLRNKLLLAQKNAALAPSAGDA